MYFRPSLSHTQTHTLKSPAAPMPATRAVYQVIIVWLQRFIICTDWVTTDSKGQAPLTRCSQNIFPRRPRVCPPSPPSLLKGLIANAFVWGRREVEHPVWTPPSLTKKEYECCPQLSLGTHTTQNIHMGAVWEQIQSYLKPDSHQTQSQHSENYFGQWGGDSLYTLMP